MSWQDFTLAVIKLWKGKLHHKIALVLVATGATALAGSTAAMIAAAYVEHVWGITPTSTPAWISFALLVPGLLIAAPDFIRELRHPPHPHDVELLGRFREQIDCTTRVFLREREFLAPIPRCPVDRLETMNHAWQGALYEFRDPSVQNAFRDFYQRIDAFLNDFQYAVWIIDNNPNFYTVKTLPDIQQGLTQETRQKVARMRELAAAAYEKLNDFERVALDRIG